MHLKKVFLIFVWALLLVSKSYSQESCKNLFTPTIDPLLYSDLSLLQLLDVRLKSSVEIAQSNGQTLSHLYSEDASPALIAGRKGYLTMEEGKSILAGIFNSTASPLLRDSYEKQKDKIGYCFGRALYFHIALLKNKVHKSSIKKVWVIGPMKYGEDRWHFHVATLVKFADQKWYALDTNQTEPTEVRVWAKKYLSLSNGSARLYITDPKKFAPNATYSKVNLGLKNSTQPDWYSGYFRDMMKQFRSLDQ